MGKRKKICINCGDEFKPRYRDREQRYCSRGKCQRARRARWQRLKINEDPDYRENQRRCERDWHERHSGYYRKWRQKHTDYTARNRILQRLRNAKRSQDEFTKMIATMDVLNGGLSSRKGKMFKMIPQENRLIAKMDVMMVKLIPVQHVRGSRWRF